MDQAPGAGRHPISINTSVAEHGATGVLSALQYSRPEHVLPPGYFGKLTQAFVKYGHVDADSTPTRQQEALFAVAQEVNIDNQGKLFSLLGAILDAQVEDSKNGTSEAGHTGEGEYIADAEPMSPYAMGAYVLLCALGVSNKRDSQQSRSLAAFRGKVAEFDFTSHTETILSPQEVARRIRNDTDKRNRAHQRKEDSTHAKAWLRRLQATELGAQLLEIARDKAEITTALPGRFIDVADVLIGMGVVDRIGKPLAKILEVLNVTTNDPREGIRYAAALQDTYLAAAFVTDNEYNVQRMAPAQIRVLLLLCLGLPLTNGSTQLGATRGSRPYNRLLERASLPAFREEMQERILNPDRFPEPSLGSLREPGFTDKMFAATQRTKNKDSLRNEVARSDVIRLLARVTGVNDTEQEVWACLSTQLRQANPEEIRDLQKDLKQLDKLLGSSGEDDRPKADSESTALDSFKYEQLTAVQEVELAFSIEAGLFAQEKIDKAKRNGEQLDPKLEQDLLQLVRNGQRDKERFIRANIPLVLHWSKRNMFQGRGLRRSDLIQEGHFGLIRAVEKFDYTKGYKFSTYAAGWLDQVMLQAIADQGRTIRLPYHIGEELGKMRRAAGRLEQKLHRSPSDEEIAQEMGISHDRFVELKQWGRSTLSLSQPIGEDGELGDILGEYKSEPEVAESDLAIDLEEAIGRLPERDAMVIRARFYESLTQQQIADRLGMTRSGASYLEQRALKRIAEISPQLRQYLSRGNDE